MGGVLRKSAAGIWYGGVSLCAAGAPGAAANAPKPDATADGDDETLNALAESAPELSSRSASRNASRAPSPMKLRDQIREAEVQLHTSQLAWLHRVEDQQRVLVPSRLELVVVDLVALLVRVDLEDAPQVAVWLQGPGAFGSKFFSLQNVRGFDLEGF